jgi:hypothetical protein
MVSITYHDNKESGITDGVSASLVLINVWRLAGDTLNNTCNFLYCNYQVHRYFMITLYMPQLNAMFIIHTNFSLSLHATRSKTTTVAMSNVKHVHDRCKSG